MHHLLTLKTVNKYSLRCFDYSVKGQLRKSCLFTHAADMEQHEHPVEVVFLFTTINVTDIRCPFWSVFLVCTNS